MAESRRDRFIIRVTLLYGMLATAWILLSDTLLNLFDDPAAMVRLSTVKGIAFVAVTALLLFVALRTLARLTQPAAAEIADPTLPPRWIAYAVALMLSLQFLVLRQVIMAGGYSHAFLILLMFPIIVSGGIGGLGPGLTATAMAAVGTIDFPLAFNTQDLFQWTFLIANGVLVSVLSERLHKSRRQALALREYERNFRLLFEDTSTAIVMTDPATGVVLDANAAALKSKGCSTLAEWQEAGLWAEPPYSQADAVAWNDKVLHEGPQHFEWKCPDRQGNVLWHMVSLTAVRFQGRDRIIAIAQDITDRKQWETDKLQLTEALRRSEQLMRSVLEGSTDAVFVKDGAGRYLLCNQAAARYLGKLPAEVIGQDDDALFPPDVARFIRTLDREILASGRVQSHEEPLTTLDGQDHVFLVTKGPVFDDAGRITGLFGIAHDITARSRAEADMRRHDEELRQRNEELERFNRASIGRELAMIELKRQVNDLSRELGRDPPYKVDGGRSEAK